MGKIIISQQEFSFQEIQGSKWPEQAPYFETSLSFCRDWLNGANSFELQTSGSTGSPKTIKVSRAQMSGSAKATGDFFNIQPEASLLCCLNTAMIAGKMMLVRAMEWDSLLHLVEPSSNPLAGFSADQTFDFATMVPLQLETSIADEFSSGLVHRIQNLLIGGAPPSAVLREKASKLSGNIFQTYGMTETVSHIALADLKTNGPLIYKSLPGVQVRQDHDLRLEIMAPMSNHEWIATNDIVEILSGNRFIWKGRSDFTINSGGIKVQPEAVEETISDVMKFSFPLRRFFIAALPDPKLGQKIVLLVEGKMEKHQDTEQVLKILKAQLPAYHHPKAIYFVPKFEETASSKINRKKTVEIWQELGESQRGLPPINGVAENFY